MTKRRRLVDGRNHVFVAHRANVALGLGDDHVGPQGGQKLDVDLVQRGLAGGELVHLLVDRAAGRGGVDQRPRQPRFAGHVARIVALVADADQVLAQAEQVDHLGGAGNERGNAVRNHVGSLTVAPGRLKRRSAPPWLTNPASWPYAYTAAAQTVPDPTREFDAMKMFLAGQWIDKPVKIEVRNPFDGTIIDTVPRAESRRRGARLGGGRRRGQDDAGHQRLRARYTILRKAADLMGQRTEQLGRLISTEEGKILAEGMAEVSRARETIELSAEEAKRLCGEVLPLDGAPGGAGKLGFTLRVPCGVVAAITPFNFPLNLVCHKIGPALAAGNAVILKPASDTPLSALAMVEILLEAGLPPTAISCLTGSGS